MKFCLTLSLLTFLLTESVYSDENCIIKSEKTSLSDAKPIIFNISDDNTDHIIRSPGYSSDDPFVRYPLNILCAWIIVAPEGQHVTIDFDDFDVQSFPPFDVLEVREGLSTDRTPIANLSGNSIPSPIISKGNSFYLIFITDRIESYNRGFQLHFTTNIFNEKQIQCDSNQFKCRNNKCIATDLHCNQNDECGDGSDEQDCSYRLNRWDPKCGLPRIEPILGNQEYIIGGRTAIRGSWPFVASLRLNGEHSCGALLINHEWVVSAAHCFLIQTNASLWTLSFGKYFRDRHENQESIRYVKKIVIHHNYLPLYDEKYSNRKEFDIALAKLNAPLFFDNYSLPICLPKQSDENKLKVGSLCHVIGWGRDYDPESNGSLKQVEVPIVDPKVCVKDYKNIYKIDTKLMLCAGYEKGGHDSCFGDSGGPLAFSIKGKWFLMGIVSSGGLNGCGEPNAPGIYTRVRPFVKWIHKTIKKY